MTRPMNKSVWFILSAIAFAFAVIAAEDTEILLSAVGWVGVGGALLAVGHV